MSLSHATCDGVLCAPYLLDMEDLPTIINWFLELTLLDDSLDVGPYGIHYFLFQLDLGST